MTPARPADPPPLLATTRAGYDSRALHSPDDAPPSRGEPHRVDFAALPIAALLTRGGRIVAANRAYEALMGVPAAEVIGLEIGASDPALRPPARRAAGGRGGHDPLARARQRGPPVVPP